MNKIKDRPIWCDHCNTEIMPSGVRSCLRRDCKSKEELKKFWK
jgi:hypothetical protein